MVNYIELLDGTRIEAFPKPMQTKVAEDDKSDRMLLEFFLRNAYRLIEKSDTILSDSRMFLAPLPISDAAGIPGFRNPTLGIYVEWWKNNECAWRVDEMGVKRPIYLISGNPMTGSNSCGYIGEQGKSCFASVRSFSSVRQSFVSVNTRYTEAKERFEAYTIEEVVKILFE